MRRWFFTLFYSVMIAFIILIGAIAILTLIARERSIESRLRYFDQSFDIVPSSYSAVEWLDYPTEGRAMGQDEKDGIGLRYTESWQLFAKAAQLQSPDLLDGYFTGSALKRTQHVISDDPQSTTSLVFLGMDAKPLFYHIDRSFVQLQSDNALFVRMAYSPTSLDFYQLSKECTLSQVFRKTTGWQISDLERTCSEPLSFPPKGDAGKLPKLKGVNYYPKDTPWTAFWREYDPVVIERDLQLIKATGSNAVRFFLPSELFLDPENWKLAIEGIKPLENLENFLEQTGALGIYVIPTLFDFRGDVATWTWSNDYVYLKNVFSVLNEAENIAYIDLKNELDLDFAFQSEPVTIAWAKTMLELSRSLAPELSYSLGWSSAEYAHLLADDLDVISYHDYAGLSDMDKRLSEVKAIAMNKPVIVSEIGATSFDLVAGIPSNPEKQAERLSAQLNSLSEADGVLIWTLYDFGELDAAAISGSFWHKGIQKNFGLFDNLNRPKGAHEIFSQWSLE